MDKSLKDIDADFVRMHFDLKDKQDEVQKKTFMKWINSVLVQHEPPSTISDLSEDLKDGVVLLNLLKALTGEALQIEKGDRFGHVQRIHYINNVGNALQFLQDKQVKMVNIHAGDIVDGRSSIIMGLIWTLILHFQIEESTKHICSGMLEESDKLSGWRGKSEPKVVMLKWAQKTITEKYGIEVKDFGASWRNGVAFNALIHDVKPHMIDMRVVETSTPRENLERAFDTAEQYLGIPRLLDPEDVDVDKPDEKSIMTYVSKFVQKFPQNLQSCEGSGTKEMVDRLARKIKELDGWVSTSVESIQHEEMEADLQEFGSKLESQYAVCQYLASEVNKLSQRVPHNFQVAALRDQMRHVMERFRRAEETKDAKIKALHDLNSFLEKHEYDVKMFERWKNDGRDILQKLDDIIQGVGEVASFEDLEIWKDHVNSSHISNTLMENLEVLDNTKVQLDSCDGMKEQILEAFVSIKEIKENSIYKISMIEYNMEEQNCLKLLKKITTDLTEVEDSFKSEEFSHEKSLQTLEEESELVLRCQESLDAMTSICGRNFDDSFKHEIEVHLVRLQDLNSKISELTEKIQNGAITYNDYLERKFQVLEWIDKVESHVHQLKEANPELEDYETIHNDFKELMDEIGHQKTNIEESKVLLQTLAFNLAWSSRVDDETNLLCDLIKRLESLCSTSRDAMKLSSVFVSCRELKNSIREKIEVLGRNSLLSDAPETWDDIQAIKSMMEQFQTFESSVCEVESLMEKGYALLKHIDAHKFLAMFLKESFKFCCDLRNIAHEKLAILKHSLELWQSYESLKIKISGRPMQFSPANKSQLSDYLAGMEYLLGELDELGEVISKLSKYISPEKYAELLEDLESLRDGHKKEIDSLSEGMKVEELAARFEGEVCGLKKLIEDWKTGLCAEKLNEDVNMERIPQLVHRTQTLVNELTAEGFSQIHSLGELLEEIKCNKYASEDMIDECLHAFQLVESSFRGFCIEMEDLHKCTVSDADHLMRCGRTVVEVSRWLHSERLTTEGFGDISEVEEQLRRALELYSKLEHHKNSMVDVNSETSLVSESNSISCLVDKLKHELEAFKNNLDSSFQKLNDLVGSWQNLLEIKRQITSMIDSISEQIKLCKSSFNQFSAGITDGSMSDTLKIMMLELQKLLDSNRSLKSIAEEMLPHASVEFHQKISLELADNEQVQKSFVNEVLAQMDLLREMREEFENFTADVEDCFRQIEIFTQEVEDHDFVKDFIMHDQPSLHLIETFSNKFENIAQFWNHINDKKQMFMYGMDGDLQEKLLKIGSHIRDNSELMVNMTSFCGCLIEYKELVRCLKVCLAEFERNLLSGNDNEIDSEILILLEDGKHREELMKNALSVINGLKNKSSEYSLGSALEISHLTERFKKLRKKLIEFRDAASLFETLEEEVQNLYGYLNAGDAAIAPETMTVLMDVVVKTGVKNKDHLADIDRKVMELDGGFMSNMDFLERFHHRFENLKESVDDLHKKLETQHFKEQYLLEKLVTYESLSSELEKYLTMEPETLISFDDMKIRMASLQEQHNQVITYKELLATVDQDIKHFSGDEHLKLFSRIISTCSVNFSNSMEKSDALEMKLLNEIENLNVLSKHYDGFMERVDVYDTKIESLILSIQELLDESVHNGEHVSSFEEELTELKTEIVSMETAAECCLLKELCQQGNDLIASHKRRLLEKASRAQDLICSLFANVDQCQEKVTEIRDGTDVRTNKIVPESLSGINGEASTNDDRADAQLKNFEGWMEVAEEIDVLHQNNHALSNDFPIRNGISQDLLTLKEENSQLNEEMLNLQENLRSENESEKTQNRFGEFVSRVEQQLESMRTQNVGSLNEAHQLVVDLLLEGGEGLTSEIASCDEQFTWSWVNQKEELKKFLSLYEEEIIRSISLRNQLTEFESWFEKMEGRRSELCSGSATYPQLEYLKKLNDFDSHLEEKVNFVKNVSHLLNSISHFDENMQLLSDGQALVSQFHQLMDSIKEMLVKATKSLEKIEDFQKKEKKVKELMNSLKLKLSAVEKNAKLDEQMMEIVDVSVDLGVVRALVEQMDDAGYQDLSEIDLANIQSCMESLKTDLKQINQSQMDVEDKLKQKSDIYFEYQAGMKELKKWIEEKEYFMWGLKAGRDERCPIDENFDDEISTKMRFVEEMKTKMNSLNLEDFEDELNKYTAEIEAMKVNSSELSALMRDQVLAEEEYFSGLVELKDCSHEVAGVVEGNKENNTQILRFADLINTNLLDKLSKMISCLSKVQFMLASDLGRIGKGLETDSPRCLLLRIHSFQEIENLAKYLGNWILFQDEVEKYCSSLKRTGNDLHEVDAISDTNDVHQYLQNLCSSPKDHQNTVNLLKTLSESLEPVALATTCQQVKALWDDIYANGRRLVASLMHWTSVFEEVSESWNEFSSIYNEISEFLTLPKRDVEQYHLSEVQNPAQCQDKIKSFTFMEKKMTSMMEAVLRVMTFLRGKEVKVKLEADVKQLKEDFEKSRIEAELELKKLSRTVSNSSTDAVDGVTLLEENELMELLRQRKELEVHLKDRDSSKCVTRKINEIFKELNESVSKLPSGGDDWHEHLSGIENSLGKLKKEMEALKSLSGFYSGSDGLTQALFKLLDAKRDEITSEVDRRKREAGEHLDMVKQHKKEIETLEFKLALHRKWLSESDKMELNIENTEIFKFVERETRSRIHDIFKMKTSLNLMIENQRWRSQPTCSVDAGLFCSHVDMEELKLSKPVSADADNENMQLHSSIVCLLNETYSFWKRLRKHHVAKSCMDLLIDTKQLEHFNQLEMALKNRDVIEDEAHETPTSTIGCYKDILEHLVVLKLSVSSMDVSKRTISFTNVQACIRKFSVLKQELLDLVPAINKYSRSTHSLDQSASDLRCIWEVLCCNVLSQIQVLGHFMRQANKIKTKIEEFKEDLSVIECHFNDLQNMYCMSSHLEHYEELELALKEMEKELLMLLDECQRVTVEHRGCWNIQSLHIEAVNVLQGVNKFSSDLNASKLKFINKLEMWSKFSKTSSQILTKLHALEFSLRRTCKKCQLEENICLLKNTFSQELQEINRSLRNLELEKFKLSSNDGNLSTCTTFQITSLKRIFEACSNKVFVRLQKLRRVSETILKFDRSLDNFKGWMMMKETELNSPFKFLNCHFEEILRTTQALRTSQVDVELKSSICSSFFGVCQVLCHDSDACPSVVEQDAVMTTMDLLERKWNNIVCLALSRKSKLEEVWKHWKKYFADCEAAKNVVTSVKNELARHRDFENFESLSICSMKEASHFYKKLILHMEEEHQKRDELKENYKQMALSLWVDEAGEMQAELETLWSDWQETEHSIRLIGRRIGYHLDLFKMFQSSAVSLHEWLLGISASLEQMEKSFEVDPEFNCRKNFKLIKKMKREVRLKLQEFNEVAKSLDVVVEDVKRGGIDSDETAEDEAFNRGAKELLENFSKFQSEILLRIKNMEKKMNRGSHEIVANDPSQGSNVDEIESRRPISSHLDKSTEDSSALIDAKSGDWTNDDYSTFKTQILFLLLITAACLLPVSRIRASDLVHSLTRR